MAKPELRNLSLDNSKYGKGYQLDYQLTDGPHSWSYTVQLNDTQKRMFQLFLVSIAEEHQQTIRDSRKEPS